MHANCRPASASPQQSAAVPQASPSPWQVGRLAVVQKPFWQVRSAQQVLPAPHASPKAAHTLVVLQLEWHTPLTQERPLPQPTLASQCWPSLEGTSQVSALPQTRPVQQGRVGLQLAVSAPQPPPVVPVDPLEPVVVEPVEPDVVVVLLLEVPVLLLPEPDVEVVLPVLPLDEPLLFPEHAASAAQAARMMSLRIIDLSAGWSPTREGRVYLKAGRAVNPQCQPARRESVGGSLHDSP